MPVWLATANRSYIGFSLYGEETYGDKSRLFIGNVTFSSILLYYPLPMNLNLFRQTIKIDGSFHISIFLTAGWCYLHLSQYHLFYPSRNSCLLYSAIHSCNDTFPLFLVDYGTGTLRYMRQSNFVDLYWQIWHSTVDFSCP